MRNQKLKFLSILVMAALLAAACTPRPTQPPPPVQATPEPTNSPMPTTRPTPRPSATPAPTPTLPAARLISSACPFNLPAGLSEGQNIECGYLSVPANRRNPLAGTLQLAVAVIHPPDGATHADAIVYLEGGPGGSALEPLYLRYAQNHAPLLESGRDLVVFDQRGVGLSRPALDCPEQDRLFLELLDNEINGRKLTEPETDQLQVQAMQTCAQNWAARTDLSAFTTAENAADVADLAAVLGYEQVNLWGVSYGTRLALEVMRNHPEIVRSAILDSNLPPDVDPYAGQPANLARAFELLFESCAGDKACDAAFPDLREVFLETARKLDAEPATITTVNPLTGQTYAAVLTGDNLTELVFKLLYEREAIPLLPRLIYNAGQGNYDLAARLLGSIIAGEPALSDMMHFTLQCAEEIGRSSPEAVRAAAEQFPDYKDYFDDGFINLSFEICEAIGISAGETTTGDAAVESDIPSLVMAGEFDPVTPPEWSEHVAASLSSSYLYEYPATGHGAGLQPGCPRQMMLAFLDDPSRKPDAACMDEMPAIRFDVPITGEIEMEAFSIDALGLQGVRPAGWNEVNTGVFSRQNSALDGALVMVQTVQAGPEATLQQIAAQFGLLQAPAGQGQRTANNLEWTLYSVTVRGMQIDFAIAQSGERSVVALLQSAADERDNLFNFVYLPFLDSIRPIR